jgi:ubiquinone/menaquinone biosynthesis C-methylase UbiE
MFNENFFENYLKHAPLPLAVERTQECMLLSKHKFESPILDIGCGDGIFADMLFSKMIDVGVDPNSKELQRAQKTNKYSELIQCYGDNIPKPDGSFKTIFSNSVMEHIPDIKPVLNEAYRLLDNDGRLYLTLPTYLFDKYTFGYQILNKLGLKSVAKKFSNFFNKFWNHYHYYDVAGWRELFNEVGFIVDFEQEYGKKSMCMFNDFMAFFSLPSLFARKIANRWFWSDKWRNKYLKMLTPIIPLSFKNIETQIGQGGLIFFVLRKNAK